MHNETFAMICHDNYETFSKAFCPCMYMQFRRIHFSNNHCVNVLKGHFAGVEKLNLCDIIMSSRSILS